MYCLWFYGGKSVLSCVDEVLLVTELLNQRLAAIASQTFLAIEEYLPGYYLALEFWTGFDLLNNLNRIRISTLSKFHQLSCVVFDPLLEVARPQCGEVSKIDRRLYYQDGKLAGGRWKPASLALSRTPWIYTPRNCFSRPSLPTTVSQMSVILSAIVCSCCWVRPIPLLRLRNSRFIWRALPPTYVSDNGPWDTSMKRQLTIKQGALNVAACQW
jgi:hypothetical protein